MTEKLEIPEQLKNLINFSSQKYNVYFDKDQGTISAITKDFLEGTFFEVGYEEVKDFISGKNRLTDYKVVYNSRKYSYEIVELTYQKIDLDINDLIFKLTQNKNPQVKILYNLKDQNWKISLNRDLKEILIDKKARIDEVLWFSVTEKDNPNIFIRQFFVDIKQLLETDLFTVKFNSKKELDFSSISVYTNRKFETYSLEVIDE